jgi:hypothetical protein
MGFVVTSLTNYVKTNENILLVKSFFEPKTATYMQKLTGIKSSGQIPQLTDEMYWQTGGTCGLINASGDTSITARVLTVGKIKAEKSWCVADLESKYTQLLLSPGSQYEALPGGIDQAFMEFVMGSQGEKVELAIWQGDTTVWQDYLNKFDGLVKIINAASGTVQANAAAFGTPVTSITAANVLSVGDMIYNAIPAALLDKTDLKVFMGVDKARLYLNALKAANLFHFNPSTDPLAEFPIYGTNVMIVPVNGLTGVNAAYALRTSNMFLGVDLENEEEEMRVWYSEDYDTVNLRVKFKMGTQVGITSQVVKFTY